MIRILSGRASIIWAKQIKFNPLCFFSRGKKNSNVSRFNRRQKFVEFILTSEFSQKKNQKLKKKSQQNAERAKTEETKAKKKIFMKWKIISFLLFLFLFTKDSDNYFQITKNNAEINRKLHSNPRQPFWSVKQKQTAQQYLKNLVLSDPEPNITVIAIHNRCIFKHNNVLMQIKDLPTFLQLLQGIPKAKVSFYAYEHKQNKLTRKNILKEGILFALLVYFCRKEYKNTSGRLKNFLNLSFQNSDIQDLFNTSKFQAIKPDKIKTLFTDVAGMHEAKFQIVEFVDFLKKPDRYIQMGAKIPKGALLFGPPGTGKTLLARACAGEARVPFFYVSGSDFVEKYVGLGASRVRTLFEQAEKQSPSIIFIDQIDAIGKKRDSGPFSNDQRESTLNQLLVKMDGFDTKNKVVVMAATNRKDMLDPALLRPGRFDRLIQVGLPNFNQRIQILKVHLSKVKFSSQYTIEQIGKKISISTPSFSGAELANVCNEAAILAARERASRIQMRHFEKATERVLAGLEKRNLYSQEEKETLAYYECGKAVVGWFLEGADPTIKISILPFSKSSKGYSHSIFDETALKTKQQLLDKISYYLAGRASQNYFKGYNTTNGHDDLRRAKEITKGIVTKFGMSKRLRKIAFPQIQYVRKPYSNNIESLIDDELKEIASERYEITEKLIVEKKELIEKLKVAILVKETLNHKQIQDILGKRPYQAKGNYKKYLDDQEISNTFNETPIQAPVETK